MQEGRKISCTVTSETAIAGTDEDGSSIDGFEFGTRHVVHGGGRPSK